jgi:hypothetical protein
MPLMTRCDSFLLKTLMRGAGFLGYGSFLVSEV